MPLTVTAHPSAQVEIDPDLAAKVDGSIVAGPGAIVRLGRPKVFGPRSRLLVAAGEGCTVTMAPRCFFNSLAIRAEGGGAVHIAAECTFNGAELVAHDGPTLTVGRDCMFSSEIRVTTTDHHTIRDAATGERINPPEDIIFGEHVWVGRGVQVLKGARIGDGSVIGARSLVTGEIPPGCLALGVPARVVRAGIVWER